jgi:hypothetical protein
MSRINKNDSICEKALNEKIDVTEEGVVFYKETGIVLNPHLTSLGYHRIYVSLDGQAYRLSLHRLVLIKFLGVQPLECDHINNIKTDNRLCNLRYVTRSENMKKTNRTNNFEFVEAKYTNEDLVKLRELYINTNLSKNKLSKMYDASHSWVRMRLKKDYSEHTANSLESISKRRLTKTKHWVDGMPLVDWCKLNNKNYSAELKRLHRNMNKDK